MCSWMIRRIRIVDCHSHVVDGDGFQHIAAERGFVAIIRALRRQVVGMDQRGHNGHTPFCRAAVKLCLQKFGVNDYVRDKSI